MNSSRWNSFRSTLAALLDKALRGLRFRFNEVSIVEDYRGGGILLKLPLAFSD
jgi:hypothetical protein